MTIDESIEQEKFKARVDRIKSNKRIFHNNDEDKISACHRSAEEHEQLAKWLEELKAYKKNTDICPICDTYCSYLADEFENGYNKAIDGFVQKVKEHQYVLSDVINSKDYGMFTVGIEQIAEQLKAGGK